MATVLIVYGSETGHTKTGAELIARELQGKGHQVTLEQVPDVNVEVFDRPGVDAFLLGVSTWGAVEDEVQQDFEPFYEAMADADLSGRKLAVFGSGDKGYEHFARAVDYVDTRARERGAALLTEPLKWHLEPEDAATAIRAWAGTIAAAL